MPLQPTFADVLATHPEIVFVWQALTDPSYGDDVVVILHGGSHAFVAEVYAGYLTGASEPNWNVAAPNSGDTVTDGDITWRNAGLWSAFPPAPTTWQATHDYSAADTSVVLVWPTSPNNRLYIAFPGYFGLSDSSEPDFDSVAVDDYIGDGDGYWLNLSGAELPPPDVPTGRPPQGSIGVAQGDAPNGYPVHGIAFLGVDGAASGTVPDTTALPGFEVEEPDRVQQLATGELLAIGGNVVAMFNPDGTLLADLSASYPNGAENANTNPAGTHFYIAKTPAGTGVQPVVVNKHDATGAIVDSWTLSINMSQRAPAVHICVSEDDTALFYNVVTNAGTFAGAIKRWDLVNDIAMADYVASAVDQNFLFMVNVQGNIATNRKPVASTTVYEVRDSAGALIQSYSGLVFSGTGVLFEALEPGTFWLQTSDVDDLFQYLRVDLAGSTIETVVIPDDMPPNFRFATFVWRLPTVVASSSLKVFDLTADATACTIKTFDGPSAWPKWLEDCSVCALVNISSGTDPYRKDADLVRLSLAGNILQTIAYDRTAFANGLLGYWASSSLNRVGFVGEWNRPDGIVPATTPGELVFDLQAGTLIATGAKSDDGVVPFVWQETFGVSAAVSGAAPPPACTACGPGTGSGGLPTVNEESLWSIMGLTIGYQVLPGLRRDDPDV